MRDSIEEFQPYLQHGNASLDIPSIDPLKWQYLHSKIDLQSAPSVSNIYIYIYIMF